MTRILTVLDYFVPGYKAGGPIRTIFNVTEWLGKEFQFDVLTSDHDWKSCQSYPGVKHGAWQNVGNARVRYLAPLERTMFSWYRLLNTLDYDVLYLNSYFATSTVAILLLRRLHLIPKHPVIIAPRGELSPGALGLKRTKKRLYITLNKILALYNNVIWQASSEFEGREVLALHGDGIDEVNGPARIVIAPNMSPRSLIHISVDLPPRALPNAALASRPSKKSNVARLVFLSRLSRKKNLDFALQLLADQRSPVEFDIYGPVEDVTYWRECQSLIHRLAPNVQAQYRGEVTPDKVAQVFSAYHAFLFPTRGENFGHVILEALSSGCLVLTSDQTPWRDLEAQRAGWDIPLAEPARFQSALAQLLAMDDATFRIWSEDARKLANAFMQDPKLIQANRDLFSIAIAK